MDNQEQIQEQAPMMKPDNHMALAIITTICCCLPLGIVAIIKANEVNTLYMSKQYTAAAVAADEAKKWSYVGIICCVIFWAVYLLFFGGMAVLGGLASIAE